MSRNVAANNVKAYKIMFELERLLRVFISKVLQENFETGWIKGIPKNILNKCENRASREKKNYHDTSIEDSDLIINYADFKDLKDIIIKNWSLFEFYFIRKEIIENKLEELEIPRNIIAHNRIISIIELNRISVYASDLKQCMNREVTTHE